ncbi:YggT family protein [bacterium]|nr:YggT family protein [bacterium]
MAQLLITMGSIFNFMGSVWIGLILLDIILCWIVAKNKQRGLILIWISKLALPPVNLVRRTVPTVYREMDFAPWLTVFFLVLIKTFIFRALIYWGMLHRPPVG